VLIDDQGTPSSAFGTFSPCAGRRTLDVEKGHGKGGSKESILD
jgi:hypothetical protein